MRRPCRQGRVQRETCAAEEESALHPEFSRRDRQTKIVATLGPASSDRDSIRRLFLAGVDVFRLNFSHGAQADHAARVHAIRSVEAEFDRPIAVLADLQGPKLRIGVIRGGAIALHAGMRLRLDLSPEPGDEGRIPLPHPEIFEVLDVGTELLLDDGRVRLLVERHGEGFADAVVRVGDKLSDRKGVNVPNALLPVAALTEKDRTDLTSALELGADWVALSFVQRPEDVADARRLVAGRAAVMAKLEKPAAISRLSEILELADAVMVARGDLGVEMPPEDLPSLQKRIIQQARWVGKPVVVATQMLESMVSSPTPTRAEASDVATAIFDGADGIMLSAETAVGSYPIEAVSIMDRIARRVEPDPAYRAVIDAQHPDLQHTAADAITAAASQVARTVSAQAICTYTTSGSTTLRASRERPPVPILCLTSRLATARRLVLVYGVYPVHTADVTTFGEMVEKACRLASQHGMAKAGDRLVITAGVPFGTPGNTNILRLAWVDA